MCKRGRCIETASFHASLSSPGFYIFVRALNCIVTLSLSPGIYRKQRIRLRQMTDNNHGDNSSNRFRYIRSIGRIVIVFPYESISFSITKNTKVNQVDLCDERLTRWNDELHELHDWTLSNIFNTGRPSSNMLPDWITRNEQTGRSRAVHGICI